MNTTYVKGHDGTACEVTVRFVDVGQGDCTVAVDHGTGDALLIDCPKGGAKTAITALRDLGVDRLAVAIITHWHADHYGDVLTVADHFGTPVIHYNCEGFEADRQTSKDAKLPTLRRLADPEFGSNSRICK